MYKFRVRLFKLSQSMSKVGVESLCEKSQCPRDEMEDPLTCLVEIRLEVGDSRRSKITNRKDKRMKMFPSSLCLRFDVMLYRQSRTSNNNLSAYVSESHPGPTLFPGIAS